MNPRTTHRSWRTRGLLAAAAGAVLILVFLQYLNPHFLVGMADQLWSCF